MKDARAAFAHLYMRNAPMCQAAELFGLTADEMGLALHYASLAKLISIGSPKSISITSPPLRAHDGKIWCEQCQCRVTKSEGAGCASQWCKAREAIAA